MREREIEVRQKRGNVEGKGKKEMKEGGVRSCATKIGCKCNSNM